MCLLTMRRTRSKGWKKIENDGKIDMSVQSGLSEPGARVRENLRGVETIRAGAKRKL